MILLIHSKTIVVEVIDLQNKQVISIPKKNPTSTLFNLAKNYPDRILIWCHKTLKAHLNTEGIKSAFHLKNMMFSYSLDSFFSNRIGYVEDSPFLKVNKKNKYPTWLMSSQVGAIYGSQLLKFRNKIDLNSTFDYALNSIAKLGMPCGLFCYSMPKLLNSSVSLDKTKQASTFELFKFVKTHYKSTWQILLLINIVIYERKFPVLSFLQTVFYTKKRVSIDFDLELIQEIEINKNPTIDVIIPTIGRKAYLYNVLLDLSKQTLLPIQVIIIEQNENVNSISELDYVLNNQWPFKIIHKFIKQTGVCNARNLALEHVTANYVYLADDDNRFSNTLLETIVQKMQGYNLDVITMSYLQEHEVETRKKPLQWSTFGAGSSVLKSKYLEKVRFNKALEFGYGEDVDFGMQLRQLGTDVIYFPNINIKHLKAPIGGFRTPFKHPWKNDNIQPKPSPTVMLSRLCYNTEAQLLGYKTTLFIKFYKSQSIKNPLKYFKNFKKQWRASQFWAYQLKEQNK